MYCSLSHSLLKQCFCPNCGCTYPSDAYNKWYQAMKFRTSGHMDHLLRLMSDILWTKNIIHIVHRSTTKTFSSGWPLTSPITEVPGCKWEPLSPAVLLSRLWAEMQNKQILDKEWFSAIMMSLQRHWKSGVPTISVHLYMLTDDNCALNSSRAENKTNKLKGTNAKSTFMKRS